MELSYKLPAFNKCKGQKVILSMDPGSVNMGLAATLYDVGRGKARALANCVMSHPVKGMVNNLATTRDDFVAEVETWMSQFKPDGMIAERFQPRGLGGNTIEEIGMMLGMTSMIARAHKIPYKLITAATWKNKFNRRHDTDLKAVYKQLCVPPHQLDATLIGVYGLEYAIDKDIEYSLLGIIKAVERASVTRLIKGRIDKRNLSQLVGCRSRSSNS